MRKQIFFVTLLMLTITACAPLEAQTQKNTQTSIRKIADQVPTESVTPTETEVPTPTDSPTDTVLPTPTDPPTATATLAPSATHTASQTASATNTLTLTPSPTPIEPFYLYCAALNNTPSTRVTCYTSAIPKGKRFVIEHVSGTFDVGADWPVDRIVAGTSLRQVYLPTHFASRELGGPNGLTIRMHQFGSPVKMYVDAGEKFSVSGDAGMASRIVAFAIGYLIDL